MAARYIVYVINERGTMRRVAETRGLSAAREALAKAVRNARLLDVEACIYRNGYCLEEVAL